MAWLALARGIQGNLVMIMGPQAVADRRRSVTYVWRNYPTHGRPPGTSKARGWGADYEPARRFFSDRGRFN
jgi:hypothetical protein